uniref:Lipid storage droplets surface-binding protein 1 n=1 Tax=Clastoptera arizonana TaxID=38151 RepID=A0A1B6EDA1_9HEMI
MSQSQKFGTVSPKGSEENKEFRVKSLQRIASLPAFESAVSLFEKAKGSSFLVRWSLKPAEMSMWVAVSSTKPLISLFPVPVLALDYVLCSSLDMIEKTLPVVTYPPGLVYNISKDFVASTFVSPVLRRANSVKEISLSVANKGGEMASTKLNNAIDVAEKFVDIYLPDTAETPEERDSRTAKTINHMNRFGRKLQRRITRRTIAEAQALKKQSLDTINCIIYLADLLARDPKAFIEKAKIMWQQLSEDEPENQIPPENVEQLINMIVRESSRRVVHLTNYVTGQCFKYTKHITDVAYVSLMNIFYWTNFTIKVLHLQFITNAIIYQYTKVSNFSNNFSEQVLTFIRQLNLVSGHPALIPTPPPQRRTFQSNPEANLSTDNTEKSQTESHKESTLQNNSPQNQKENEETLLGSSPQIHKQEKEDDIILQNNLEENPPNCSQNNQQEISTSSPQNNEQDYYSQCD